ncbi:glycosyltransferase family 25 protein [Alteromonas flava]|uniref:glycosyltransferase family 25 protein n=1 Tax=Alteromonas flava TaxID=2048003 RepID=UPI000C2876CB|nr:glycosyltransferase family 25 protein [Alteromonas flava]
MSEIPCFVINLARSKTRMATISLQLTALNIPFQRIEAVDGSALSSTLMNEVYAPNHPEAYYKSMNKGEIACYLSHRSVWQRMVDENIQLAVVLEDDVQLNTTLADAISAIQEMPNDWDYIKLAQHARKRPVLHHFQFNQFDRVTYAKVPARTCAQAISLAGAKKLLAHSLPIIRPIDIDLQYWWEKDLRLFGLMPYPATPSAEDSSDIEHVAKRKRAQQSKLQKLRNMWRFYWQNRYHNKRRLAALAQDPKR